MAELVRTVTVTIKGNLHCRFCGEKTINIPYYKDQEVSGYYGMCSCKGALDNYKICHELDELEERATDLRCQLSEIPTAMDKLMPLQEQERSEELQRQLTQAVPPFSFAKDSQQPTSQPE